MDTDRIIQPDQSGAQQYFVQWKVMTCPSCLDEYTLGKTGTINGCDRCEGICRDASGMIIPDPFAEVFIVREEEGDPEAQGPNHYDNEFPQGEFPNRQTYYTDQTALFLELHAGDERPEPDPDETPWEEEG